jgi:hypothetical protein
LRHIKLFESFKKGLLYDIRSKLTPGSFDELPIEYQKTVVIPYFETGGDIDWSYELLQYQMENHVGRNWMRDEYFLAEIIKEYSSEFGTNMYLYGIVDTQEIIDLVMSAGEFSSYAEFRSFHQKNVLENTTEIYPIYMSNNAEDMSYIEDGWHRLHRYINMQLESIPVLFCK